MACNVYSFKEVCIINNEDVLNISIDILSLSKILLNQIIQVIGDQDRANLDHKKFPSFGLKTETDF